MSRVTSRCAVSRGSSPMSTTMTSPAWKRPGPTTSPTLRPCIVTVTSASTAAPSTSPVEAFTPDGMSTASTGAPDALIRSIVARGVVARRAAQPGAEQRVDHEVRAVLDLLAGRAPRQDARRDPAVAAVRAAAREAARTAARRGKLRSASSATARPARSISVGDVVALLGGPHLVGRVERLEHQRVGDDGDRHRELAAVRHREVDRAGGDALRPRPRAAVQRHARLRPARRSRCRATRTPARRRGRAPCRRPPCRRSGRRTTARGSCASRSRRARPR